MGVVKSSDLSKRVNRFFLNPITSRQKKECAAVRLNEEYIMSDEQEKIFKMRYLEGKPIDYISDLMGFSPSKVKQELSVIRVMLDKLNIL